MEFDRRFARLVCCCFLILEICSAASTLKSNVEKDDSSSQVRRYLLDQQPTTHFSSDLQRIACATTCIETYKNITENCCHTGDNRICYDLLRYTDVLKTYVGRCSATASTTHLSHQPTSSLYVASSSTTKSPVYNSTKSSTVPALGILTSTSKIPYIIPPTTIPALGILTSTSKIPYTIPPTTKTCVQCAGPEFLCEKLYEEVDCDSPANYCINKIVNRKDGTRSVTRGCGNFDTCYKDYFLGSSDIDKCRQFDENNFLTMDFDCTFCCIEDSCNVPLRPDSSTLYKDL